MRSKQVGSLLMLLVGFISLFWAIEPEKIGTQVERKDRKSSKRDTSVPKVPEKGRDELTNEEKKRLAHSSWICTMDGPMWPEVGIPLSFNGKMGQYQPRDGSGQPGFTAYLSNIDYHKRANSYEITGNFLAPTRPGKFRWKVNHEMTRLEGTMWLAHFDQPIGERSIPGTHARCLGVRDKDNEP
jgi:hypothetical protein